MPVCDVELRVGTPPPLSNDVQRGPTNLIYASQETNAAGEPALRILDTSNGEFLRLIYEDGTEFWVDRNRQQIWAAWADSSSFESMITYLFGPVLGLVLRLRGVTCLHASAVAVGDSSVAFVGTSGAGKSTTAAAFARRGFSVLSDDIVALRENDNGFHVMPGYPYLCLWPPSTKIFHDSPDTLPRIVPDEEKRRLMLGPEVPRFESRSLPLGAVYSFGVRRSNRAPYVERIRARAALLSLVADTYANKILDRDLRAREFAVLGHLVEGIPVRRIVPHEDLGRINDLCDSILEDLSLQRKSAYLPT